MLIAKPIQDKEIQKELSEKCGVEYDVSHLAYSIELDGKMSGIAVFFFENGAGVIRALRLLPGMRDLEALEIAGRGVMSFLDTTGTKKARMIVENEDDEYLAKRMFFKKNEDGTYTVNLAGYFHLGCEGHKK